MLAPSPSSEMGPKDGGKKSGSVEALAPKPQGSPPPRPCAHLYCRMGRGHYCCCSYSCSCGPGGCYLTRRQQPAVRPLVPTPGSPPLALGPGTPSIDVCTQMELDAGLHTSTLTTGLGPQASTSVQRPWRGLPAVLPVCR